MARHTYTNIDLQKDHLKTQISRLRDEKDFLSQEINILRKERKHLLKETNTLRSASRIASQEDSEVQKQHSPGLWDSIKYHSAMLVMLAFFAGYASLGIGALLASDTPEPTPVVIVTSP